MIKQIEFLLRFAKIYIVVDLTLILIFSVIEKKFKLLVYYNLISLLIEFILLIQIKKKIVKMINIDKSLEKTK